MKFLVFLSLLIAGLQAHDAEAAFAWHSLPSKRSGFGVLYCAYNKDSGVSLPRFLKEAGASAARLKKNNPGVATAIITNAKRADVPAIFEHLVPVHEAMLFAGQSTRGDGVFRQWFSRIYYLAHSPFEITWYVDSHAVFATTALQAAFEAFANSTFDIAVPSSRPHLFRCHNFALLFRWNWRVKNLFADWIMEQLRAGISADDQAPLCRSLFIGTRYGLNFTAISPQWAFAWLSTDVDAWADRTTRVLRGKAHICHSPEANLCTAANLSQDQRARVFHYKRPMNERRSVVALYNPEQVRKLVSGYPEFDWLTHTDRCSGLLCTKSEAVDTQAIQYYFGGTENWHTLKLKIN